MTESITWMTPLEAITSVATMDASLIFSWPPASAIVAVEPSIDFTSPGMTSAAFTSPASTW